MSDDLPKRPALDERIKVAVSPAEKRRVFEVAAERGMTASELVRRALIAATTPDQRAAA